MNNASSTATVQQAVEPSHKNRQERPILKVVSYAIFLSIPIIWVVCYTLFLSGWETRALKLREELCSSFWSDVDGENKSSECVQAAAGAIVIEETSPRKFVGGFSLASRADVVVKTPEFFAYPDKDTRPANEPRCAELQISTFDLRTLTMSQDATYDSIARRIEACTQAADKVAIVKLCTGTRSPLGSATCRKSLDFLEAMQVFDRTPGGIAANTKLIIANISFGVFQLVALVLLLIGVWMAIDGYVRVRSPSDPAMRSKIERDQGEFYPTVRTSAEDAAYHAMLRSEDEDEQKRLQSFLLRRDAFREKVTSAFNRTGNLGDIIVLVGLLGTLWGMLVLFSALAESGSAEPLTAELAKSKMLGSLGLAFGTTIFAGVLRLIYTLIVPQLQAATEDRIDRAFLNHLTGVEFRSFGPSDVRDRATPTMDEKSLISVGYMSMKAAVPNMRRDFGFRLPKSSLSSFDVFFASVFLTVVFGLTVLIFLSG